MGAIRQELRAHSMVMWTEVLSPQPKIKMPNSIYYKRVHEIILILGWGENKLGKILKN